MTTHDHISRLGRAAWGLAVVVMTAWVTYTVVAWLTGGAAQMIAGGN